MAASRLEKIGTIYSRATGLIKSKAMSWEDRPLWYDVYEAFPPKDEPKFDRPIPNMPIKQIFYEEDKIRANNKQIGTVNLFNNKQKTLTQKFVETYQQLQTQYKEGEEATEENLYKQTIDLLKRQKDKLSEESEVSLSSAFKAAQSEPKLNVEFSDIFKNK